MLVGFIIFILVLIVLGALFEPPRQRGIQGSIWIENAPPITPLTPEEAAEFLNRPLPHALLCQGAECECNKGNNMAKYTPEQLLTRAGHRHPDDILNALKQEYKLVPLPSDDAGDFGAPSLRRTNSPEA
jgi:hypothetical protein